MWEAILEWDREGFLWLNGLGSEGWDGFWLAISDKWVALPLYLFLLWLSWRELGWKSCLMMLFFIALLLTCTDQLSNFFKFGVGRLRPCHEPALEPYVRLVKSGCGGMYGYFSAHAANAFGVAAFFATLWGRKRWAGVSLLMLWAVAVGYSRIYLGVHYPLDILSGFFAGGIFGWMFARLFLMARQKWIS